MKRYKRYKPSGIPWIGEIPEHWDIKRIKYILKPGKDGIRIGPFGSSLRSEYLSLSGYKIYGQENVINNDFNLGWRYLSEDKFLELSEYEIMPGDVLVTMMGTTGKCKLVPKGVEKGIMDSHLIRMRIDNSRFESELLADLMNDSYYIFNQVKMASKGSIMEGLNSSIIKEIQLILPLLNEQTAIADYLSRKTSEIDDLITKKKRLIELLNEEKTAIINHAVMKGLNPNVLMKDSGIPWLGEIPADWGVKKLKYIVEIVSKGTTPSTVGGEVVKQGPIRFLKAENILQLNKISIEPQNFIEEKTNELLKRSGLQENDVLIVIAGATIGKVAILNKELLPANTNQAVCFIRLTDTKLSKWIWLFLQSRYIRENILLDAVQAAQPNLGMEKIGNFRILFPPTEERAAVEKFIDAERATTYITISKIDKEIELLKEYRTALISEAVTGKIDVRGAH